MSNEHVPAAATGLPTSPSVIGTELQCDLYSVARKASMLERLLSDHFQPCHDLNDVGRDILADLHHLAHELRDETARLSAAADLAARPSA